MDFTANFTMGYVNFPSMFYNSTDESKNETFERTIWHWILSILLFITAIVTLLGNGTVMITFFMDKRLLRSHFNIFLLNLTITDIAVSITAIPLFGVSYFLGSWPDTLGPYMCAVWMFCDWGMTFASVYTLVVISVDRYWAVCWSHHYRANNTRRRTLFMIAAIWIVVLVIWVPPFLIDRTKSFQRRSKDSHGPCMWSIEDNKALAIYMAICGNHLPTLIIIFTYIRVFVLMRKSHISLKPEMRPPREEGTMVTTSGMTADSYRSSDSADLNHIPLKPINGRPAPDVAKDNSEMRFSEIRIVITPDDESREASDSDNKIIPNTSSSNPELTTDQTNNAQKENISSEEKPRLGEPQSFADLSMSQERSQSTQSLHIPRVELPALERLRDRPRSYTDGVGIARMFNKKTGEGSTEKRRCKSGPTETIRVSNVSHGNRSSRAQHATSWERRDYKLFVRVTYIVVGFLICWTPFHIVFDLLIAGVEVNEHWYAFSGLMCYLNSTINPILYALGNPKMKTAFKNTVACVKCKVR